MFQNTKAASRNVKPRRLSESDRVLIERGVEAVVRYYCGRWRLPFEDDVRQEAWLWGLDAHRRHDPDRGSLLGWVTLVARRQVGAYIDRTLAAVSISRGAATRGVGAKLQHRIQIIGTGGEERDDGARTDPVELAAAGPDPEEALARRRETEELVADADAARDAMLLALGQLRGEQWRAGARIIAHVDAGEGVPAAPKRSARGRARRRMVEAAAAEAWGSP